MRRKWSPLLIILFCLNIFNLVLTGCSPNEPSAPSSTSPALPATATALATPVTPVATPTTTPTATAAAPLLPSPTATQIVSACAGLNGDLEISVLVGPADVVGLEPVAVGQIPFSTSGSVEPFPVSGNGIIDYADTLEKEWGTYAVTMNMQSFITGSCSGAGGMEILQLAIEFTGDQLVVVTAEGFQAEYPWNGTHNFELEFPLLDGASNAGEGWAFVLHLGAD